MDLANNSKYILEAILKSPLHYPYPAAESISAVSRMVTAFAIEFTVA